MLRPNIEYVLWSRTLLQLACLSRGLFYYWIRGHVTVIGSGHSQQAHLCLIDLLNNGYMSHCPSLSHELLLTLRFAVVCKWNLVRAKWQNCTCAATTDVNQLVGKACANFYSFRDIRVPVPSAPGHSVWAATVSTALAAWTPQSCLLYSGTLLLCCFNAHIDNLDSTESVKIHFDML